MLLRCYVYYLFDCSWIFSLIGIQISNCIWNEASDPIFLLPIVYFKLLFQIVLKCKEEYLSAVTEDKDKVNAVLEVTTRWKLWWKLLRGESCGGSYYEANAVGGFYYKVNAVGGNYYEGNAVGGNYKVNAVFANQRELVGAGRDIKNIVVRGKKWEGPCDWR